MRLVPGFRDTPHTECRGRLGSQLIDVSISDDRRVTLVRPVKASHLRFTSRSGTLLILPDVEFIKDDR